MVSNRLPKRQKRLLREERLTRKREAHRLSRLGKRYSPFKDLLLQHGFRVAPGFASTQGEPGRLTVVAPSTLDFDGHCDATLAFISGIHRAAFQSSKYHVFLDMSALESLTPDAAVVLLAEVVRCSLVAKSTKRIGGNYPTSERARQLLDDIGFYRALRIRKPNYELSPESRVFLKTVFGNRSDGRFAKPLITLFDRFGGLGPIASKRLYAALIECMDNVKAHAYQNCDDKPDLIGEWYMCGFVDQLSGELAFVFFDQGAGIPATIKTKKRVRFKSYMGFSDAKIIERAVTRGLSRRSSLRHGNGLPSLKDFIDFAPQGSLRLISQRGDFTYCPKDADRLNDLSEPLSGSLIVWRINLNKENIRGLFLSSP